MQRPAGGRGRKTSRARLLLHEASTGLL